MGVKCPQLNLSNQELSFLEKFKAEPGADRLIVNLDKTTQKLDKCK